MTDPERLERLQATFEATAPARADLGERYLLGPPPGTRLGTFVLGGLLGRGATGAVFEARDEATGRLVAVKVLDAPWADPPDLARFQREAELASSLDHEGIVRVLETGRLGETPYLVMERVVGWTGRELVQALRQLGGLPQDVGAWRTALTPLLPAGAAGGGEPARDEASSVRWVTAIALRAARALAHAHQAGIVHRDVKPENVMVTPSGRVVLLDFGLARAFADPARVLTDEGVLLGSTPYCAPEVLGGSDPDARSDVWSLGVTLYELLTGQNPFQARNAVQVADRVRTLEPPRPPGPIPDDLATIVACALEKGPRRRYADAAGLADDLERFLSGLRIVATRPGALRRAARRFRRPRTLAGVGLAGAVALAYGGRGVLRREIGNEVGAALAARAEALLDRTQHRMERLAERLREHETDLARRYAPDRASHEEGTGGGQARERAEQLAATIEDARDGLEGFIEQNDRLGPLAGGEGRAHELLCGLMAARVRMDLLLSADVSEPERFRADCAALARVGRGDYAELLAATGDLRIECALPGARLTLFGPGADPAEGAALLSGVVPPIVLHSVREGVYTVAVRAPGHALCRVPVLVRRAAADQLLGARPPRTVTLDAPPLGSVPEGFVFVPGGWTLVDTWPPGWLFVDSFQICETEVCEADWRRVMGDGVTVADRAPVRARPYMELGDYPRQAMGLAGYVPPGWMAALPTLPEWRRAARGAGGRRFAWGDGPPRGPFHGDGPGGVGTVLWDRSAFDVLGMSTGVAELTATTGGGPTGTLAACGGSFRDVTLDLLALDRTRVVENAPVDDVGLRLALHRLPPELRDTAAWPRAFRDDFERGGDDGPGGGWLALTGELLSIRTSRPRGAEVTLREGRLRCAGGTGQFSLGALALHPVRLPAGDFVVRALVDHGFRYPEVARGVGLGVESDFLRPVPSAVQLTVDAQGTLALSCTGCEPVVAPFLDPVGPAWLELRAVGRVLEARRWSPWDARPDAPVLQLALDEPWAEEVQLVRVFGANLVGGWIEVDELTVGPNE